MNMHALQTSLNPALADHIRKALRHRVTTRQGYNDTTTTCGGLRGSLTKYLQKHAPEHIADARAIPRAEFHQMVIEAADHLKAEGAVKDFIPGTRKRPGGLGRPRVKEKIYTIVR